MALVGFEIIQSRTWIDPHAQSAPKLNHKNVFPITVFDAVRTSMQDENSTTLTQTIDRIDTELNNKQPLIPARSANNLITYAGVAGQVGSIQISDSISDDYTSASNKIPTEKAIGTYVNQTIENSINIINSKIFDVAITYDNPIIKVRPDKSASDENGTGNLIPDVQWVLDKIEELLNTHEEAFMEKLKTIIPCLAPKPPKTDQVVEGLTTENIEGIVNGTTEPDPSEKINIGGYVMERIPDPIVEAITDGTMTPNPASRIVVNDIWIESIDDSTVLGIMDGTVKPTTSKVIIPAEIIEDECPCHNLDNKESPVSVMNADMINSIVSNS